MLIYRLVQKPPQVLFATTRSQRDEILRLHWKKDSTPGIDSNFRACVIAGSIRLAGWHPRHVERQGRGDGTVILLVNSTGVV